MIEIITLITLLCVIPCCFYIQRNIKEFNKRVNDCIEREQNLQKQVAEVLIKLNKKNDKTRKDTKNN